MVIPHLPACSAALNFQQLQRTNLCPLNPDNPHVHVHVMNGTTARLHASDYTSALPTTAAAQVVLPVLATAGIYLRFHVRIARKIPLRWDDFMILLTLPFTWTLWAVWLYATTLISHISILPSPGRARFLLLLWIHDLIYFLGVTVLKSAVLLLYLRLFAKSARSKRVLYILFVACMVQFLMRLAKILVLCFPLHDIWDDPGRCVAPEDGRYLHRRSVITEMLGLVTEVIMVVFPVPAVLRMRLPSVGRKAAAVAGFLAGGVACAMQGVRVYVVEAWVYKSNDFAREAVAPMLKLCAVAEMGIGTLVVCVVAIWGPMWEWVEAIWRRRRGDEVLNGETAASSGTEADTAGKSEESRTGNVEEISTRSAVEGV
ncbi:hypothetical protein Dda_7839 [Drechslerella dactyloides]|uniref:Rhodopsin domain-containing protein n=1 Tax=Drechslerella dactyloides TaxID=74499 RepID=A0AAD6IRA1_DREDA|nr:hypothetical protein Dda_7839 [Drechslerella dactyloides]